MTFLGSTQLDRVRISPGPIWNQEENHSIVLRAAHCNRSLAGGIHLETRPPTSLRCRDRCERAAGEFG